jgi:xanthosine utilization system XapX-like protein
MDNVLVYSGPVIPVPAPGAVALLGLAGLAARRRRR